MVDMGDEIDLRQYIDVIVRGWKFIVAAALVAALAAAVVSFSMPPVYEARAGVIISRVRSQVVFEPSMVTLSDEDMSGLRVDIKARQSTLAALGRSPAVEAEVIRRLEDTLSPEERRVGGLLENGIEVEVAKGEMIEIRWRDKDPARAALITNTWAEEYERCVNRLYGTSTETPASIEAQLAGASENYEAAEVDLLAFVGANKITELKSEIGSKKKSLNYHYGVINQVEELTANARALLTQVNEAGHSGAGQFANGLALVQLQIIAMNETTEQPSQLQLTLDVDAEMFGQTRELRRDIEVLIIALESQRDESYSAINESGLLDDILRLEQELEEEEARGRELMRARDLAWATYKALARKMDEATVAVQAMGSEVKFAMPAIEPRNPVAPRKMMNTAIAGILGLMIGLVGVFAIEYFGASRKHAES